MKHTCEKDFRASSEVNSSIHLTSEPTMKNKIASHLVSVTDE